MKSAHHDNSQWHTHTKHRWRGQSQVQCPKRRSAKIHTINEYHKTRQHFFQLLLQDWPEFNPYYNYSYNRSF